MSFGGRGGGIVSYGWGGGMSSRCCVIWEEERKQAEVMGHQ